MTFIATIPTEQLFSWESQVKQYPRTGKPGVRYFKGWIDKDKGQFVDCLLYRDRWGTLLGILNHYPYASRWEDIGNVNIWVHPAHQKQGIGTSLVTAAITRWDISLDQQRFTEAGAKFAERLRADGIL